MSQDETPNQKKDQFSSAPKSSTHDEETLTSAEHDALLIRMRWKVRLVINIVILALSFIGILISSINPSGSWLYWRIIVNAFALLCLWLTWYMRRNLELAGSGFWRMFFHWVGTLVAIYILAALVDIGVVGNLAAGMLGMVIVGLSFFIAGIYVDLAYLMIGIVLAIFSVATAFIETFLPIIMLPVLVVVILVIWFIVMRTRARLN